MAKKSGKIIWIEESLQVGYSRLNRRKQDNRCSSGTAQTGKLFWVTRVFQELCFVSVVALEELWL